MTPSSEVPARSWDNGIAAGYSAFVFPAVTGDVTTIAQMFERGLLGDGLEACLIAAANGQVAVLEVLHGCGCDLARIAHDALVLAAANGRVNVIQYFADLPGGLPGSSDAPLRSAVLKGRLDVVRHLHERGAGLASCGDVGRKLVSSPKHRAVVEYLASHGVNSWAPQAMKLVEAARSGHLQRIREALQAGIDIAPFREFLLDAASRRGHLDLVAYLHQQGCDIRHDQDLPLRLAAEHGHLDVVDYIHKNGADLHARGDEAVRLAAENGHLEMTRFLIERGVSLASIDATTLNLIWMGAHRRVLVYLGNCGVDALREHRTTIEAMHAELYRARPVYRPSKLWEFFNSVNMEQLRRDSLREFKRSINQNYFNFVPHTLRDPQILTLARWWLLNLSRTPFRLKLVDPDRDAETGELVSRERRVFAAARRFRTLERAGRALQFVLYRWLLGMLWDFVSARDQLGLVEKLSEPRLGSPLEAYVGRHLISQDLAHSILECNSIFAEVPPDRSGGAWRIAEVGAGYGRLAYVILKAIRCRYAIFDIPPSLYVSQWYLSELFPEKKIFRFRHFERFEDIAGELAKADVAFFTANQIELMPSGWFDLTINISSLHEFTPEQIDNMLAQIYRVTRRHVYLKQYKEYINPYDGLRLLEDTYKLTDGWRYCYYRDDSVDSRFFETLIEAVPARRCPAEPSHPDPQTHLHEPTVSLLLANYNNAEYLPTSLSAICGQTHQALEVIVVDDGSTDNSVAVIESYAQRFPNIRLIRNERNRGQLASIQRALAEARGDYVAWAAADDLLLPRFLERSLDVLREYPEAGLCFSRLAVFVDGTTEWRAFTEETDGAAFDYGTAPHFIPPDALVALLERHYLWISGNTVLAKRHALLEMGGFEKSLRWHSDWFGFYVVALRYGACAIPETLALMRERQDTYSREGMEDPVREGAVLRAILGKMKSRNYRDLAEVFRTRPSLLSLFGRPALFVALRNPRHWDIAWNLAKWHVAHERARGSFTLRRMARRLYGQLAAPARRAGRGIGTLLGRKDITTIRSDRAPKG